MSDAIKQFMQGFVGGITGFVSGLIFNAFLPAFNALNIQPIFWVFIILVITIDFMASIREAYYFGLSYSIGVLFVGFLLSDLGTIVIGCLSFAGLIVGK